MIVEILKLIEKYNEIHGTPKKGHSSYCRITSYDRNAVEVIPQSTINFEESFHGQKKTSAVNFKDEESCLNYLKFFTV